jgi:bilirubin oxidase
VLDRNGNAPGPEEAGWKDVVLVPPGDSLRFITKFTDFPDTAVPYMYHCHILMHEDDGMMGQYVISPNAVGIPEHTAIEAIQLYPNPVTDNLDLNIDVLSGPAVINIYDQLGQIVYTRVTSESNTRLNTENWNNGMYMITIAQGEKMLNGRFVVNHLR